MLPSDFYKKEINMKAILPREMLWTDKKTMDEFFELDPINEKFFEVFVTLKEEPFDVQIDELKVFNEVYYQTTRMIYEHAMPDDIQKYIAEIKENLGWQYSAHIVLTISYFLIIHTDNIARPLNFFTTKKIKSLMVGRPFWRPFWKLSLSLKKQKLYIKYDFKPNPVPVKYLADKYIRWNEITSNYDTDTILEIYNLWHSIDEKKFIDRLIETNVKFKSSEIREKYYHISKLLKESLYGINEKTKTNTELEDRLKELDNKVLVYEKDKKAQQKHIEEIEADNLRLKTLLERKKETGKDRRFTLVQIVEYSKKCVTWDEAKPIVAMLNKLLRKIRTDEDDELVDSIEEEFINRTYGDTVMGDKNEFNGNSAHNTIKLPPGMSSQEAMKLLQNKTKEDGEER